MPGAGENAHAAFLARRHQGGEFLRDPGIHLEAGFAVIDANGADISLGHITLTADFRQQPFRVGVALAAYIQKKPRAIGLRVHGLAGRAITVWLALAARRAIVEAPRFFMRRLFAALRLGGPGVFAGPDRAAVRWGLLPGAVHGAGFPKYLPARAIAPGRV